MDHANLIAIDIHTHAEVSCWNPFDNYGEEYDRAADKYFGSNRLPTIGAVQDLGAWLKQRPSSEAAFVLSPPDGENFQAKSLFEAVKLAQAAHFLIGPEGGFSAEELQAAQAAGCSPCHLGARVLRAETAPLYILAALAARELQGLS